MNIERLKEIKKELEEMAEKSYAENPNYDNKTEYVDKAVINIDRAIKELSKT